MKLQLLVPCFFLTLSVSYAQQKTLTLTNPTAFQRNDELIVLKRNELKSLFKKENTKEYLNITTDKGRPVIVQLDDLDHDGKWDEAVFLHSFKAKEKAVFILTAGDYKMNKAVVKAHVRHRRKNADQTFALAIDKDSIPAGQPNTDFSKVKLPPFLTEGPAWENDKVGFRLYFDVRNGKDIWGKTTTAMMMDTVGADLSKSYHHKSDWGMDIYKVGSSLSAGALGVSLKLKDGRDSLVRLGGKNMGKVIYEKVADGPLRAIFRMHYPQWKVQEGLPTVAVTEEISIWGGQYFYQSKVYLSGAPAGTKLVTGFANLFGLPSGELGMPGSRAYYSYGIQSENNDNLGLAVVASPNEVESFDKSGLAEKDIKDTYLVTFKAKPNAVPVTFRFYAAWEPTDERFKTKSGFTRFLTEETIANVEKLVKVLK